jgi:hypothetical protein
MKLCPQCRTPYTDPSLIYCLKDGVVLIDDVPSGYASKEATLKLPDNASDRALCPDSSLHDIAEYEIKRLQKFVLVETCMVNSSPLSEGKLYIEFKFPVINLSIYSVTIPMIKGAVIEGSILFKGNMLSGSAKMTENDVRHINPTTRGHFIIRQWINLDEAKDIVETLGKTGNLFDFSNINVHIKSDEFPDAKAAKLDLTRGMQNADLENKLIQVEAELRAKRDSQETLNAQHRKEVAKWQIHADKLYRLSLVYGMALQADDIIDFFRQTLSKGILERLRANIDNTLIHCFGASYRDKYFERQPPVPDEDELNAQMFWIRSIHSSLEVIIEHERQKQLIE